MHNDIQKAALTKRFAAGLLDLILLVVLACGCGWGASAALQTNVKYQEVLDVYTVYGQQYDVEFNLSTEEQEAMSEAELEEYKSRVNTAVEAMNNDDAAVNTLMRYWYAAIAAVSIAILAAHLILEFAVPLIFGNGQTLGKKLFGIALMRTDGVKVNAFVMFARGILGKCTVEIMVPVLILFMLFLGAAGVILAYLPFVLLLVQVALCFFNRKSRLLHDLMACTVAVDMASQFIFDSPEALLEYQKARAAEEAENAEY